MDNFRDSYFQVDWDLTTKRLRGTYWGKQYDTGRGFAVTVINGGQVVAPTTEVLRLKWEKPDNTTGYVNATIVDGKFIVENIDQMFTVQGSVRADFELSVAGESLASITFYVSVEKAVAVDAIESSSDFTALQDAVGSVDSLQQQFNNVVANVTVDSEVIAARGTETTLGARLDSTDAQLADIENKFEIGKNLFDKSKAVVGYWVSTSSGNLIENASYTVSDYIKVIPNENYSLSAVGGVRMAFYDENFVFISALATVVSPITTPSNCMYLRYSFTNNQLETQQLEIGSSFTGYEPYKLALKQDNLDIPTILSSKRTPLGESAKIYCVNPPVISKLKRTITFSGLVYMYYRDTRIVIADGTGADIVIPFPTQLASVLYDLVFYDISTNSFKAVSGGNVSQATEYCVFVMAVTINASGKMDVICDFDYVAETELSKNANFGLEDIVGHYNSAHESCSDFSIDPLVTTITDFQNAWNTLISGYSDYVTTTIMGKDESGLYDIYKYDFRPKKLQLYQIENDLPTIILIAGIHGNEKSAMFGLYYLIKDMLENWGENSFLEYLRFNCNLVIMPIVNPYGFQANTRNNFNDVDINRNFEYKWTAEANAGTGAFSELETQYIKAVVDNNLDAIYYLDCHNQMVNSGIEYPDTVVHVRCLKHKPSQLDLSVISHIDKMTRIFNRKYDSGNGVKLFGATTTNDKAISPSYANDKGVLGSLIEGFPKFPIETEYYSSNAIKGNSESIGNWLLNVIQMFRMNQS